MMATRGLEKSDLTYLLGTASWGPIELNTSLVFFFGLMGPLQR